MSNIKLQNIFLRYLILSFVVTVMLTACSQPQDHQARIKRAIAHHAKGELRASMIELKNVLQEDPKNGQARLELGKLYISLSNGPSAEKELRHAIRYGISSELMIAPLAESMLLQRDYGRLLNEIDISSVPAGGSRAKVFILRGNSFLALGKDSEATQEFEKAMREHSSATIDARLGLTRIEIKNNDLESADGLILSILSENSDNKEAWLRKGIIERNRHNYAEAEKAFSKVVELSSSRWGISNVSLSARLGLIQTQMALGRLDESRKNLDWLMDKVPQHPAPKYFRALLAYGEGDFDTAATFLQEILTSASSNKAALKLMGAVNYARGNLEQADMYLGALLRVSPEDLTARKLLAATRLQLDRPDHAIDALEPAFKNGLQDSEYLALVGAAYLKAGDYDAGVGFLKKAVEANPENKGLQKDLLSTYINAGKVDEAIQLIERMQNEDDPKNKQHKEILLILTYMRAQRKNEALKHAEILLADRPEDPFILNLVGGIMAALNIPERAMGLFEKAIELKPAYEAAVMNIARLSEALGNLDDAEKYYKKVLKINPDNAVAMFSLARIAEHNEVEADIFQWLEKARDADPRALAPRLSLVRLYLGRRDFQQAREIAEEAFQVSPQSPDVLNALGVTQMWAREYIGAEATFKKAIRLVPTSPNIAYNLARAQLSLSDIKSARRNLQQTLRLSPDHIDAAITLAALDIREGKNEQALRLIREQQGKSKNKPMAYSLEGDIHLIMRKYADAINAYHKAWNIRHSQAVAIKLYSVRKRAGAVNPEVALGEWLKDNPDDSKVRMILAQEYQNVNRLKDSMAQYELILREDPKNAVALNNLAWLYYKKDDHRALGLARRAYNIAPDKGAIVDTLGWLLTENGNAERGVQLLKRAIEMEPRVPKIRYHLAIALSRSGQKQEARNLLKDMPELKELLKSGSEIRNIMELKLQ